MAMMSKNKGDKFECKLRVLLEKWWGCPWERTTLHHGRSKKNLPGDLVAINPEVRFPFLLEAKHTEQWSFDGFVENGWGDDLGQYLIQVFREAEEKKQRGLLLLHRNRRELWAIGRECDLSNLPLVPSMILHTDRFPERPKPRSLCERRLSVYPLADLMLVPPPEFAAYITTGARG